MKGWYDEDDGFQLIGDANRSGVANGEIVYLSMGNSVKIITIPLKDEPKPEQPNPKPTPKPTPKPEQPKKEVVKEEPKKGSTQTADASKNDGKKNEGKKASENSKELTVKELKDKNVAIKKEGGKYVATFKDEDGNEVKQEVTEESAKELGYEDEEVEKEVTSAVEKKDDDGKKLPNTATPMFNLMFIGAVLTAIGVGFFFVNKRKKSKA